MKIERYILTLFIGTATVSFGQTFKKDWAAFNPAASKDWTIIFNADSSRYIGRKTRGQLILRNKKDTTLLVTYYVYDAQDCDNVFMKKINDWMFIQSCGNFTNGKINFSSFGFKKYYYVLKPCHRCETGINKDCATLANQIFSLALKG